MNERDVRLMEPEEAASTLLVSSLGVARLHALLLRVCFLLVGSGGGRERSGYKRHCHRDCQYFPHALSSLSVEATARPKPRRGRVDISPERVHRLGPACREPCPRPRSGGRVTNSKVLRVQESSERFQPSRNPVSLHSADSRGQAPGLRVAP